MVSSVSALRIALRGLTIGFGVFAILWGARTFPVFRETSDADAIAARIIAGEPFKMETLLSALPAAPDAANDERARYLRSLSIIRLRLTELHIAASADHRPEAAEVEKLEASISQALAHEPADAYLWLILSVLRMVKQGITEASVNALRMSYLCGPNEGWIAVIRNRLVMSHFADLPKSIQDDSLTEFKKLVVSGYATQTAEIVVGPGWPLHERLLMQIESVPDDAKRRFAMALHGLNDLIVVPGVTYSDRRHNI
jgi:hypothetical protein